MIMNINKIKKITWKKNKRKKWKKDELNGYGQNNRQKKSCKNIK